MIIEEITPAITRDCWQQMDGPTLNKQYEVLTQRYQKLIEMCQYRPDYINHVQLLEQALQELQQLIQNKRQK